MRSYLQVEKLQLVHSGKEYFDFCCSLIANAKSEIHLQTYIFESDQTGLQIAQCLCEAARRGVRVFLLVDAIGSFGFPSELKKTLTEAGVKFRLFAPMFSGESLFVGRRLHHKILVVDRWWGLVGGINIADKYNDTEFGRAWLDYSILSEGAVNEFLHLLCEQFYFKRRRNYLRGWEKKQEPVAAATEKLIRYRINDWIRGKNEIHQSYVREIRSAKNSLIIVASYFLPGRQMRRLITAASRRGVRIRLIMAGRSDLSSVRLAENYLYEFYFRNKIELFEWQNSVMHGKAMIRDEAWATVGSYNLNFLSHYASVELNAETTDREFIVGYREDLLKLSSEFCTSVNLENYCGSKYIHNRLLKWLAFYFFRLIKNITMFGSSRSRRLRY